MTKPKRYEARKLGDPQLIPEAVRGRLLRDFLEDSNIERVCNFIGEYEVCLFGVYFRGYVYRDALALVLWGKGYTGEEANLYRLATDKPPISGFTQNATSNRKILVVDEAYDLDQVAYPTAAYVNRYRDSGWRIGDFRFLSANPFLLLDPKKIFLDKFNMDLQRGTFQMRPEDFGQKLSIQSKELCRDLDTDVTIVPAGDQLLAMAVAVRLYAGERLIKDIYANWEGEIKGPKKIAVVGTDQQIYRRLAERYGERVVFKSPANIVR